MDRRDVYVMLNLVYDVPLPEHTGVLRHRELVADKLSTFDISALDEPRVERQARCAEVLGEAFQNVLLVVEQEGPSPERAARLTHQLTGGSGASNLPSTSCLPSASSSEEDASAGGRSDGELELAVRPASGGDGGSSGRGNAEQAHSDGEGGHRRGDQQRRRRRAPNRGGSGLGVLRGAPANVAWYYTALFTV